MRKEPLTLLHPSLLKPKFEVLSSCFSDYSFANAYLFRKKHDFQVVFDEEMIWIEGRTRDEQTYWMPTEDLRAMAQNKLVEKLKLATCFYPIAEEWLSSFENSLFKKLFNRDDSDYFFKRDKIADFPGRKLSSKRNLLKQFFHAHLPLVVPYEKKYQKDALFVLENWQSERDLQTTDFEECREALRLSEELGFLGFMTYVEDEPAGFILGEILHPKLFDVHFTKGLNIYKGIYPYLFQELANRLSKIDIRCLNWEQDLGQEGLRQSKLSYQPDKIAPKYRIYPK